MIHDTFLHDAIRATWAIRHSALRSILGTEPTSVAARRKLPKVEGRVAVLPVHGVISQRASIWDAIFGGTSTEALGAAYTRAVNDDRISAIVLDVDSPGGTVAGVEELADIIFQGSQIKETAAIANSEAASAAFWIASQVGFGQKRFAAAPGSDAGSIGVFRMHEDHSEAMASEGVQVTFIATPEFKTEANPFAPLSKAALDHHGGQVQDTYDRFVAHVARGRGVSAEQVRSKFGKGRTFESREAARVGMVDRVSTLAGLFGELGVNAGNSQLSAADCKDMTDTLCHAWECGLPEPMANPHQERAERMRKQMGIDKPTDKT